MAKTVIVGCKLPNGIIIESPLDPSKTVTLNGKNKAVIIGSDYGTTEVEAEFWEAWIVANKDFPALKSGAIFFSKSVAEVQAVAKELEEVTTGFEPMRTDGKDKRAKGVVKKTEKE